MRLSRQQLENGWDVFMLLMAIANLLLIAFDLTYISLRPRYLRYAPSLVARYDPYKGIEPHQLTATYQKLADSLVAAWKAQRLSEADLREWGDSLFALSVQILSERPYERFGLMGYQELLKTRVKDFIQTQYGEKLRATDAFRRFWSLTPTNAALHLDFYQRELRYYLSVCYYRHYDLSGHFVDKFWKLDLPFLVFFWMEFWAAWWVALRTRRYRYWWMYPVAHWYDVLALTPFATLRWFRLLRIWNLYLRLNRSKVLNFSNTLLARALSQQSRVIAKAISNEVAFQIIEQIKRQSAQGEDLPRLSQAIREVSPLIQQILVAEAASLIGALRQHPAMSQVVEESVTQVLQREVPSVPGLPRERLIQWGSAAARRITERTLENLESYLTSPKGQAALSSLSEAVIHHLLRRLDDPAFQAQLQETTLTLLTQLQRSFRSLPDTPPQQQLAS